MATTKLKPDNKSKEQTVNMQSSCYQHSHLLAAQKSQGKQKNGLCLPITFKFSRSSAGQDLNSIKNLNGQSDRRMWILASSSTWGRSMGTEKVIDTKCQNTRFSKLLQGPSASEPLGVPTTRCQKYIVRIPGGWAPAFLQGPWVILIHTVAEVLLTMTKRICL